MRRLLIAALVLAPAVALAEDWTPAACGDEPAPPHYSLGSRTAYNDAVKTVTAYQQAARDYSSCVLKAAHDDETKISRQAQNRIADIQTIAVGKQQEIYARLAAQAAAFKAAAARLKDK
jgi:pyocin large subunit-like protein